MYYSESLSDECLNHDYRGGGNSYLYSYCCGFCGVELLHQRQNHDRGLVEKILDIFPCCAPQTSHSEPYSYGLV